MTRAQLKVEKRSVATELEEIDFKLNQCRRKHIVNREINPLLDRRLELVFAAEYLDKMLQ